jgi:methionyl-tRNA formyltransferase
MTPLRLVFMGSPDFALPTLDALTAAGHHLVAVYTQPPRPAGRGRHERPSPVHVWAERRGLPVRTPRSLRAAGEAEALAALAPDAVVVAAYGLLLPPAILAVPRLGCFNVHASLLPRWRGAAPIQHAILAGDRESGVSIMLMDQGLDTGAVVLARRIAIAADATGGDLHDGLAAIGAAAMVDALAGMADGSLVPQPQPSEGATYAAKLGRDDGRLHWRLPAAELERAVRALQPWPGAWFEHSGERIKVVAAAVADGCGAPGTVLDDRLTVACGEGGLRPLRLQRAGREVLDTAAFLRGRPLPAGTRLAPSPQAAGS